MAGVNSSRRPARSARALRALHGAARVLDRPVTTATLRDRLAAVTAATGGHDLDAPADLYGDGVVAELEQHVADLLGTPDAAFFPSGTMAQQAALRCWAGRGSDRTVAVHALSHTQVHESGTLGRLADLLPVPITTAPRPTSAADVREAPEPFGTLLLELPLRDAGFLLPSWDELVEVTTAARERGARVHLDGARLWECTTHLQHPLHEIAALADTVYVSFYKSLRGLSGAALAGPRDVVEQARVWRHRYGGNVFQQFPAALTALHGLADELPRLPSHVAHARVVADALSRELAAAGAAGAAINPATPHTHQFQLWLPHPAALLEEATTRQAEETGTALFAGPWREPGLPPGLSYTEITVGREGLGWTENDVRAALRDFLRILSTTRLPGPG